VKRFRGGLVFRAHRLLYHLTLRLESNKEEEEGRAHQSVVYDGVVEVEQSGEQPQRRYTLLK